MWRGDSFWTKTFQVKGEAQLRYLLKMHIIKEERIIFRTCKQSQRKSKA